MFKCTDRVDKEALTAKYKAKDIAPFEVEKVGVTRYDPHPFMIGTAHVEFAADYCNNMLGVKAMRSHGCCEHSCGRPVDEHLFELGIYLKATNQKEVEDNVAILKGLVPELEADGIEGFAFILKERPAPDIEME